MPNLILRSSVSSCSFTHRIPATPSGNLSRPAFSEPRGRLAAAHLRESHAESRAESAGARALADGHRGRSGADGEQALRVRAPREATCCRDRGVETRKRRSFEAGY